MHCKLLWIKALGKCVYVYVFLVFLWQIQKLLRLVTSKYVYTVLVIKTAHIDSLICMLVPIIPSYLYTVDDEASQTAPNHSISSISQSGTFQSIVSLYDNSTRLTGFSPQMSTVGLLTPAPSSAHSPQNHSDCPKANDQLLNENVKVGLLFASKATVQLITNPFIGPLTNRWVVYYNSLIKSHSCIQYI